MEKKVPMRTCLSCRTCRPKKELARIVKNGDTISYDGSGKLNGRGAYVCKDKACIEKLKKQKLLNRAFSCFVEDSVYDSLMEEFLSEK
ncbi:MAG: YlxR family protein [Firmicutes bacterium]|nr:YlxR family protein [Candidatus Caballimonas caccae]